ncbi:MAG: class F sortase [Pseudonocardiaceae bacterium]
MTEPMMPQLIHGDGRAPIRSAAVVGPLLTLLCAILAGCGQSPTVLPPWGLLSEGPPLALPSLSPAVVSEATEQVADPVRVRIPTIGVDAPVGALRVDENGVLPPPDGNDITGWWQQGPEPGEKGPAVITGHVDSYSGPAVFFRLHELRSGDEILIDRADGSTAVFATQRIRWHDMNAFPTEHVYGDTPDSQLRLITCGGDFDYADRRYLDNIIVYALRAG